MCVCVCVCVCVSMCACVCVDRVKGIWSLSAPHVRKSPEQCSITDIELYLFMNIVNYIINLYKYVI